MWDEECKLIAEYMQWRGLKRSLALFREEASAKGRPTAQDLSLPNPEKVMVALQKSFDSGDTVRFFKTWERVLPARVRNQDENGVRLEFYLRAYFSLFPSLRGRNHQQHHGEEQSQERMQEFKGFLESRSGDFSKRAEFLPYFALPYVTEPATHPSFTHLFHKSWWQNLFQEMSVFVEESLSGDASKPALVRMLEGVGATQAAGSGSALSGGKQHEMEILRQEFAQKLEEKHSKHMKLFQVTLQLVRTLEGFPVTENVHQFLEGISHRLSELRPDGFVGESRARREAPHLSVDEGIPPAKSSMSPLKGQSSSPSHVALAPLDYDKIRETLLGGSEPLVKSYLLQALRWRLTKTSVGRSRRSQLEVLISYVENDLLHLRALPQSVLLDILLQNMAHDHSVREYTLRLMNSMASFVLGRKYLLTEHGMIEKVIKVVRDEEEDTCSRQNAIGILQKFSLRRSSQAFMIEKNVIRLMVRVLSDAGDSDEGLSDYTSQYGTALLMNLLLRHAGKVRAEQLADSLLSLLMDMLDHENLQVRTYINGALYSALARAVIREKAKEVGLPSLLIALIRRCEDEDIERQLGFIQQQLNADVEDDEYSDTEEDWDEEEEGEEDETDDLDGENDTDDEFEEETLQPVGVQGEQLLCQRYLAGQARAQEDSLKVSQSLEGLQNRPASRALVVTGESSVSQSVSGPVKRDARDFLRRGAGVSASMEETPRGLRGSASSILGTQKVSPTRGPKPSTHKKQHSSPGSSSQGGPGAVEKPRPVTPPGLSNSPGPAPAEAKYHLDMSDEPHMAAPVELPPPPRKMPPPSSAGSVSATSSGTAKRGKASAMGRSPGPGKRVTHGNPPSAAQHGRAGPAASSGASGAPNKGKGGGKASGGSGGKAGGLRSTVAGARPEEGEKAAAAGAGAGAGGGDGKSSNSTSTSPEPGAVNGAGKARQVSERAEKQKPPTPPLSVNPPPSDEDPIPEEVPQEYMFAFSTRPKIARTPAPGQERPPLQSHYPY